MQYTAEEYEIAVHADFLADYLLYRFPQKYKKIDKHVYKKYFDEDHLSRGRTYDKSIPISFDYCGYRDFAHDEDRGTPIDYLVNHEGYTIVEAVKALAGFAENEGYADPPDDGGTTADGKNIELPPKVKPKALFGHLCKYRGISYQTVRWLLYKDLLYETVLSDKDGRQWHNMCFINKDKTRIEIKQTVTFANFKNNSLFKNKDDYWAMGGGKKIYVCESAIDAISLFELRQEQAKYVSIASVTNTAIMERLKKEARENGQQLILAVDSDLAGYDFRMKYPTFASIDPMRENRQAKDWSDLLRIKKGLKKVKEKELPEDYPF